MARRTFPLIVFVLLVLATTPARALPLGAVVGTVEAEVEGKVGVYRCQAGPMTGLAPGDVVAVVRAGANVGEATVIESSGALVVISLKADLECLPGDQVVYLRKPRSPVAATPKPRPPAQASPAPPPPASLPEVKPAPTVDPAPGGEPAPPAEGAGAEPPAEPPAPAPDPGPPPAAAAPAEGPAAEDHADLEDWLKELDGRNKAWYRPLTVKGVKPAGQSLHEKAASLARKRRYLEAAAAFQRSAANFEQVSRSLLGTQAIRAREAYSLALESQELRALCLLLAGEEDRALAEFKRLARVNPPGVLASSRALSTVRSRANRYLQRFRDRARERRSQEAQEP